MVDQIEPGTSPSLRERQKLQVRSELISAALQLVEGKGLDATSVEDIVVRAGVAKGTFYLYFKAKAEIVASVLEDAIAELEARVANAMANAPDNASRAMATVVAAQLAFFTERNSMTRLLLGGGLANAELPGEAGERLRARYANATTGAYERIVRKGMLQQYYREVDAHLVSRALYAMLSGMIMDAPRDRPLGEIGATAMALFEHGIVYRT